MSTHIGAPAGGFSDVVLMPGDPMRAKHMAERYLQQLQEVTNIRGMLGYTGFYKERRISIMGHGMGVPSCSIYAYELIADYDVKTIIRVGSCGGIMPHVKVRDLVIGLSASTDSSVNRTRLGGRDFAPTADYELVEKVVAVAREKRATLHVGSIYSSDLFYNPDQELFDLLEKYGVLAVEMEAAGLYGVAAELGAKALTLCTVSDHVRTGEETSAQERQSTFNEMAEVALEATLRL